MNNNIKFTLFRNNSVCNPNDTIYPIVVKISSVEDLKTAVSKDHVSAKLKENRRKNDNFLEADNIVMDLDNDHSDKVEDWKTPKHIKEAFPNVLFYVVYSRNHNKFKGTKTPRPRLHVYFPIEKTTDKDDYKTLKDSAYERFHFFDANAKDIARFFYGVKEPKVEFYDGEILLTDFIKNNHSDLEKNVQNRDKDIIPEGQRNSTLFRYAVNLIKKDGDTQDAKLAFLEETNKCKPPLEDAEILAIWKSALKYHDGRTEKEEKVSKSLKGKTDREPSQAEIVLSIIEKKDIILFHDQYKQPFVIVPIEKHHATYAVKGSHFEDWLQREFYYCKKKPLRNEALTQIVNVLKSRAIFEGDMKELDVRVKKDGESIWVDLSDAEWRAVRIDSEGWEIISNPPPLFLRYEHQLAQVEPKQEGDIYRILKHINIKKHKTLFLCYLVACFIPNIPRAMLILHGEKGSAKTTALEFIKEIIDPSQLSTLTLTNDSRSLVVNILNHYYLGFDNVSNIKAEMSDTLCRIVTGGGIQQRKLFTDNEAMTISFKRCLAINGINNVATKSDLLDRSLLIELKRITESERREVEEVRKNFEKDKPIILGGVLNVLSQAMAIYSTVELKKLPRMADWAKWCYAIGEAMGNKGAEFLNQFEENTTKQNDEAINSNAVATLLVAFMSERPKWEGMVSELLFELKNIAPQQSVNVKNKYFPSRPNQLARQLNSMKSNLESVGIKFEKRDVTRGTLITINNEKAFPLAPLPPYIYKSNDLLNGNNFKMPSYEANISVHGDCGDNGYEKLKF